ncbi:MAG: AAA family ATPase [Actinomycetota bacterium]|nr:AAA family ATPase [Actinomycetota bacterium]
MIVVGDDRQLGAIGPGGALTALADRHPERCWTLGDNLRQADPGERAALANLRDGHIPTAVAWYTHHGRVHPVPDRRRAVQTMIRAWAVDTAEGRDTLLVAYRHENVDALNAAARAVFEQVGLLTGPELTAPGGRSYRIGDRVITLAPGPHGAWVTSQPAVVTAVKPDTATVTASTADGRTLRMGPDDIGSDRLAHGYAITAHRAQGSTVDAAHVLHDGGGRELAYVAMSRARTASHVYVTAGDLGDAVKRLAWGWDDQRRQQWATDQAGAAQAAADMRAERDQLRGAIPPGGCDGLVSCNHWRPHAGGSPLPPLERAVAAERSQFAPRPLGAVAEGKDSDFLSGAPFRPAIDRGFPIARVRNVSDPAQVARHYHSELD